MCRCQRKLKLRLALRRWWKRYAKFKAVSRLIRKWKIPYLQLPQRDSDLSHMERPPEPQLSYGWNAAFFDTYTSKLRLQIRLTLLVSYQKPRALVRA